MFENFISWYIEFICEENLTKKNTFIAYYYHCCMTMTMTAKSNLKKRDNKSNNLLNYLIHRYNFWFNIYFFNLIRITSSLSIIINQWCVEQRQRWLMYERNRSYINLNIYRHVCTAIPCNHTFYWTNNFLPKRGHYLRCFFIH